MSCKGGFAPPPCAPPSYRPGSVATACCLVNTLCKRQEAAFVLRMLKIHAAAWRSLEAIAHRFHGVSSALLAFAQRAPRRSAIF